MTKRLPQLADKHDCTGCMACVGACRVGALTMQMRVDGHGYPSLDAKKCVNCLSCENVCQSIKRFKGCNDLNLSKPYAVWANDDQLRFYSTSGGFAAAVSKSVVEKGDGVVGVSFDGRKASHIFVENVDDIKQLQGSKYVWSDASAAYQIISDNLFKRRVLFIGTGCQVAGVLSCFTNHPNRERLYTIDLICGGVPSDLLMEIYRKEHPEIEAISSFRTKRIYEMKGIIDGKERVLPKKSLPLMGFCAEQTMRYICYDCPFSFAHRHSDITIGDLWGESAPVEQREKGVSLVIAHTKKGRQLIQEADVTIRTLEWRDILASNKRLVYGHTPMTCLRKNLVYNYIRKDATAFARLYGFTSSPKHIGGFIMRVWYYLRRKVEEKKSRIAISKLLSKSANK